MELQNLNQTLSKNGRSFDQKHNINYSAFIRALGQERRIIRVDDQEKYLKHNGDRKERRLKRYAKETKGDNTYFVLATRNNKQCHSAAKNSNNTSFSGCESLNRSLITLPKLMSTGMRQ